MPTRVGQGCIDEGRRESDSPVTVDHRHRGEIGLARRLRSAGRLQAGTLPSGPPVRINFRQAYSYNRRQSLVWVILAWNCEGQHI